MGVVLAGAGEVGEELDHVADVDGDEEGRVLVGERAGVGLGLAAGADHGVVPARGAHGRRGGRRGGEERELRRRRGMRAALGFEDEAAALVEVDAAGGAGAREGHRVLEAVAVGVRGVGAVRADQVDQVVQERLRGGELARVGVLPARDEGFGVGGRHGGRA